MHREAWFCLYCRYKAIKQNNLTKHVAAGRESTEERGGTATTATAAFAGKRSRKSWKPTMLWKHNSHRCHRFCRQEIEENQACFDIPRDWILQEKEKFKPDKQGFPGRWIQQSWPLCISRVIPCPSWSVSVGCWCWWPWHWRNILNIAATLLFTRQYLTLFYIFSCTNPISHCTILTWKFRNRSFCSLQFCRNMLCSVSSQITW